MRAASVVGGGTSAGGAIKALGTGGFLGLPCPLGSLGEGAATLGGGVV